MNTSTRNLSIVFTVVATLLLSGCGSSRLKARQEQREKAVNASGLYCEWVNSDRHSDFDVEVNLQMSKRCDSTKPFSLVPVKNSSDQNGVMYCCGTGDSHGGSGQSYAPPVPRRPMGPPARRVAPQNAPPSVQAAPSAPSVVAPSAPAQSPSANSEATDLSQDEIVEDK